MWSGGIESNKNPQHTGTALLAFKRARFFKFWVLRGVVVAPSSVCDERGWHCLPAAFVGFQALKDHSCCSHLHDDAVEEFSSGAQLHDHVKAVLAVKYFVQFDDVRVIHRLHE